MILLIFTYIPSTYIYIHLHSMSIYSNLPILLDISIYNLIYFISVYIYKGLYIYNFLSLYRPVCLSKLYIGQCPNDKAPNPICIYMYIHTYIHTKALNNTHKPHTHTFSSVCMYIYIHMTYIDRAIKINKQIYIYRLIYIYMYNLYMYIEDFRNTYCA